MQLEALQSLALSVAAARSPDAVIEQMVQGLGRTDGMVLTCVWLVRREREAEPFLELKASLGASPVAPGVRWNRTDGAHQKIPLSYGKLGQIAQLNQPLLLQRSSGDWLLEPEWADAEGIQSFAGQPLCVRSEVLGVVAFLSRKRLEHHDLNWLRVCADQAAVALVNARAFEELERQKVRAERERDYLRAALRTADNLRELQDIVERALVLRREGMFGPELATDAQLEANGPAPRSPDTDNGARVLTAAELQDFERQNLLCALELSRFQIAGDAGAARRLGMRPSTLAYRMKQLGIQRPRG